MRFLLLSALCAGLSSCAQGQPATATKPKPLPLRALLVSGGPSADYNQYAIESNARYVEKLTARAASTRILFADGKRASRTISTLENAPDFKERAVLAWLFDGEDDSQRTVLRAPTLRRLDGPATKTSVLSSVRKFAGEAKRGERGLLYFTGHGSEGVKPRRALSGPKTQPDYENTTYALWNDEALSVRELAGALQSWPAQVPLVLVMVQCHAGGFANALFAGGDPSQAVLNRDFCGFFAATGDRQASGCTSEVDERDYQDFTTHFFAALSGTTRDGRPLSGADYDKNGAVSLLEAFAWTNLQDGSIDVPVCTSDAYLRSIFPQSVGPDWTRTPYSQLTRGAAPWQRAMLNGLSRRFGLTGENRVAASVKAHALALAQSQKDEAEPPSDLDSQALTRSFDRLQGEAARRFPGVKAPRSAPRYAASQRAALQWLATQPADVEMLWRAWQTWNRAGEQSAAREAMLWRFVRGARTLYLQNQLAQRGTASQKAVFARLRAAESRNPLR